MIDRLRPYLFPALALALAFAAWRSYGWQGLILAVLMIIFWVLLQPSAPWARCATRGS